MIVEAIAAAVIALGSPVAWLTVARPALHAHRYARCLANIERLEIELGYRPEPTTLARRTPSLVAQKWQAGVMSAKVRPSWNLYPPGPERVDRRLQARREQVEGQARERARAVTPCAYCGRGNEREGKAYCSAWCARRGAAHSAAASRQRNAALRAERERPQERNRIAKLYRQLAFGDVNSAARAIFEPAGRKRRRRLGLLRDPEGQ